MANNPARHKTYFEKEIVPVMDKVMKDLTDKQREEFLKNSGASSSVLSMAAGPDGGMTGLAMHNSRVYYTGEWNSKHTEDYIKMVKAELKRKGVTVTPEIENLMIDKMVKDKIPKSSIEYIAKKAIGESIFGLPTTLNRSELEEKIENEAENRYNPSLAEKTTAFTSAAALDFVSMGGVGSGITNVGKTVWQRCSSFALKSLGWGSAGVALAACAPSEGIEKKTIQVPLWMKQKYGTEIYCQAEPENMKKALDWAEKNAKVYDGYIRQAEKTGHKLKVGNQVMTLEQLQERQQQYALFAKELRRATTIPEWMLTQKGIKTISSASTADLEKAQTWAKNNGKAYIKMLGNIDPQKTLYYKDKNGKVHSIREADERVCQYWAYCQKIEEELSKRALKNAQKTQYTAAAVTSTAPEAQETQPQMQAMQQELQQKKFSPWGELFKNTGLSELMKHPGLSIAMLPDMLLGMFTGKETSFGLNKGTMIPLAALLGAGFVKSPMLKILLTGVGATGLFAKTAKEISPEQGQTRYMKYADEKLDDRIKNVTINGTQIVMDIDGVPRSVMLPQSVADAYKQGVITENTLANAVLKKYDEQQRQLSENYENQQTRGTGVGIK